MRAERSRNLGCRHSGEHSRYAQRKGNMRWRKGPAHLAGPDPERL